MFISLARWTLSYVAVDQVRSQIFARLGPESVSQQQQVSGGVTTKKNIETYLRFGALCYICCTKINFVNFKVILVSLLCVIK